MAIKKEYSDLFRCGVERVLKNWTALKLAVEHGTAGPNSENLAMNLIQYIGDIFCEGGNIDPDDVADVLVEVMDTQFQTWCEDGSPNEISHLLCRLHYFAVEGNMDELRKTVDSLAVCTTHQSREMKSEELNTSADEEGIADESSVSSACEIIDEEMPMEEDSPDPGWTEVKTRRKRIP